MRICPFCLNKIESTEVDFLFEDEFTDWDFLRSMRKIENFPLNAREDKKYVAFRRQKKLSVTDKADTARVFIRHEELYSFITALRKYCKKEDTGIVWDQNNQIEESFAFDDGYILTVRCKNQENEDSILEISSETMTKKASMICSHCHNILPSGFFHYHQITIGLIGRKDAGKTCMLVSLLANQRKAINGSSDVLSFEEVQTIQDSSYQELREKVTLLEENGICPDSTRLFIAPVILKAIWKISGEEHCYMVCIYDAAGELLENAAQNENVLENIVCTDGWIYLIDPKNTGLGTAVEMLSEENKIKILKRAKIADANLQIRMQQNDSEAQTVYKIMQDLLSDVDTEAQIRNFCDNLLQCLRKKQGGFESESNLPEIAFVLSKLDEIKTFLNEKFHDISLFDKSINYLSAEGDEAWRDREDQIREIFDEFVMNSSSMNTHYNMYLTSALGCSTRQESMNGTMIYKLDGKYDPIRIGEAFVRTTMALMQNQIEREDRE